jgi:hypothetical protein
MRYVAKKVEGVGIREHSLLIFIDYKKASESEAKEELWKRLEKNINFSIPFDKTEKYMREL